MLKGGLPHGIDLVSRLCHHGQVNSRGSIMWAGVIPLTLAIGPPQNDPRNLPGLLVPEHALTYKIG
jgi:hypothetical protein